MTMTNYGTPVALLQNLVSGLPTVESILRHHRLIYKNVVHLVVMHGWRLYAGAADKPQDGWVG